MSTSAAIAPPTTENCRFCWMCRHVCPVGHVTHRETLTPHAWALTIESVKRGQLSWNRETADVMYACADCGLCQTHCVTDQPLPDAIVRARAEIADAGLADPVIYELDRKLRTYGTAYTETAPAPTKATSTVALFVGDAAEHLGRPAVDAALRLLTSSGIHALPVGVGRSTGLLASSLGLHATAVALGRAVLAELDAVGVRELLVLTPGDRWTFSYVYPERLGLPWPGHIAVKTVTAVLVEALAAGRLRLRKDNASEPYAYHDPCHGSRAGGDITSSRTLLDAVLGGTAARQLFWREGRAHPCGAVGGLEFTQPALATALADSRFADAAAAGVRRIVTEDPVCVYHLNARRRAGIDVHNLYELLAAHGA